MHLIVVGFYFKVHFNPILRAGGLRVLRVFRPSFYQCFKTTRFSSLLFFSDSFIVQLCMTAVMRGRKITTAQKMGFARKKNFLCSRDEDVIFGLDFFFLLGKFILRFLTIFNEASVCMEITMIF